MLVAAQPVLVSDGVRSTDVIVPPGRVPSAAEVNGVEPIGAQSPHWTAKSPVHSLQCWFASARVIVPSPNVFVR